MKMENRNQYNSPRDRIDDALLIRLLNEEESLPEYSCTGERRSNTGCGCSQNNRRKAESRRSCGCGREEYDSDRDNCGHYPHRQSRSREQTNCSAGGCLAGYALAMVYMPDHDFDALFEEDDALSHGTLFRPLELPFYPGCGGCGCR